MDVTERLLKYVSFETTSDSESPTQPSSAKELILGAYLAEELKQIGLEDAGMDEYGYVYGTLPATEGCSADTMALVAHMDTIEGVSGKDIKARRVLYQGGDLQLNPTTAITVKDFPNLARYKGQELIVTDGTTLLGADDKAGIAEIFCTVEYLLAHPEIPHGRIIVVVTPDEEIGRGVDKFDMSRCDARYGYTLDGGTLGEIEYECFNASAARITVHGQPTHPGDAKNKMKNSILIANELLSMLPPAEAPAHTEGYEGFYHINTFQGNEQSTLMKIILRDHDYQKLLARKEYMQRLTDYLNTKYGEGTVETKFTDGYRNMKEKIEPDMWIMDKAVAAFARCGVETRYVPVRGGTDGATLSWMGMPCPNLCTGGENFHGVLEYIPVPAMEKMVEVLVELCRA